MRTACDNILDILRRFFRAMQICICMHVCLINIAIYIRVYIMITFCELFMHI